MAAQPPQQFPPNPGAPPAAPYPRPGPGPQPGVLPYPPYPGAFPATPMGAGNEDDENVPLARPGRQRPNGQGATGISIKKDKRKSTKIGDYNLVIEDGQGGKVKGKMKKGEMPIIMCIIV